MAAGPPPPPVGPAFFAAHFIDDRQHCTYMAEINPIATRIDNLIERSESLRGYL